MKPKTTAIVIYLVILGMGGRPAGAGSFGLPELSEQSKACVACHKNEDGIYAQWGASAHFSANVGCFECHGAEEGDADAFKHEDVLIATIVSPRDCAKCHETEVAEFAESHHSKGGRILGSLDNILAEVVEGNRGMITPGFPRGNSAAAVSGCWQCHGSQVKILGDGKVDPATWPNTGIGRINPDGSEGACTACHSRHRFSVAQARHPDNCGKCHMGPDHPQREIYYESKHGISFLALKDQLHLDSAKWVVGEDYTVGPTCATCHMSAARGKPATEDRAATKDLPVTHDIGMRISWNNRPAVSIRPEVSDKKMGLAGADVNWETRRANMKSVCLNCHNPQWVDNFYVQYDNLVKLYNEKFAKPGAELYKLAGPLMRPVKFANKLDFVWFEIWHHEGRRARHGASMMGPDYTHWHGTYEVARNFYSEFIPELQHLAHQGRESGDAKKVAAAEALEQKIEEVLSSENHRWFLGKRPPAKRQRRKQAVEDKR